MISISAWEDLENGTVMIAEDPTASDLKERPTRVSRTATIDGGSVIDNQGYSDGDRSPVVRARITAEQEDILNNLQANCTYVSISMPDGCYKGVIEAMNCNGGELSLSLMIESKTSA